MASNQLRFRGTNDENCQDFIYNIQALPVPYGQLPDYWRVKAALHRMTDAALVWSESLSEYQKKTWPDLKRNMVEKWPNTPQTQMHRSSVVPTAAAATVASALNPPATTLPATGGPRPSPRLYPYAQSEKSAFNIKVVAPKASFMGYVSNFLNSSESEFEGRCCTLTIERAKALQCENPHPTYSSIDGEQVFELSLKLSQANRAVVTRLALVGTDNGFTTSSILTLIVNTSTSSVEEQWKHDHLTGRLTPSNGHIVMMGRTRKGELTLFFWERRVWDDDDDVYAAELYLVRAD